MFGFLLISNTENSLVGVTKGMLICSRVLIPSLFPFTFCILFIMKSGALRKLSFLDKPSKKLFGIDADMFVIFLLSLVGGYPLGAKMLDQSDANQNDAKLMLCYCVNAGPAFIISAVGEGVFHSKQIGIILFSAHILPSFMMAFTFRKRFKNTKATAPKHQSLADNFTLSAAQSAQSLMNICLYVILFSIINAHLSRFPFSAPICMLLEVTNGIYNTNNVYTISALLGFGGISIWFQVFSLCKNFKPNYFHFVLCRVFHALSSAFITFLLVKVFKPQLAVISNNTAFSQDVFTDTAAVGISLVVMGIVFIISLSNKNYAGNMLEDVV